ncbi:hypothetical protein [Streptomyces hygroscopicus]|uniref:hypothetical protein n=1 Tax=Streptomyces hygroscopicus TaxID=1912 RepID=UPI0036959F94
MAASTDPAELLREAIDRAARLGWRTVTVGRLRRLARGDEAALPPDPATAPRSGYGQSQWGAERMRAEQPNRR